MYLCAKFQVAMYFVHYNKKKLKIISSHSIIFYRKNYNLSVCAKGKIESCSVLQRNHIKCLTEKKN